MRPFVTGSFHSKLINFYSTYIKISNNSLYFIIRESQDVAEQS